MNNLKLLIIEDDADQRDLIQETLEDYFGRGTVTSVGSGHGALSEDLASFDLILSDYNLPDCQGMDLLDKIRARCSTPVIMVTGENVGHIAAEAIRKGATDYVVKFGDYLFTIPLVVEKSLTVAKVMRENNLLREELESALRQVQVKNAELEQSLRRLEQMAATDPLTGLYNRRHFSTVLDRLYAEATRYGQELSCVMIDLDGYKQLNDTHGHQVGDQLLVMAGKVLSANMRQMDVAARYGGDEFVLLLPHASGEEAVVVAERIRQQFFEATKRLLNRPSGVTMSMGIASIQDTRVTAADKLVALADTGLYEAKDAGRNCIRVIPSQAA